MSDTPREPRTDPAQLVADLWQAAADVNYIGHLLENEDNPSAHDDVVEGCRNRADRLEAFADALERALSEGDGPLVLDRETGEVATMEQVSREHYLVAAQHGVWEPLYRHPAPSAPPETTT